MTEKFTFDVQVKKRGRWEWAASFVLKGPKEHAHARAERKMEAMKQAHPKSTFRLRGPL